MTTPEYSGNLAEAVHGAFSRLANRNYDRLIYQLWQEALATNAGGMQVPSDRLLEVLQLISNALLLLEKQVKNSITVSSRNRNFALRVIEGLKPWLAVERFSSTAKQFAPAIDASNLDLLLTSTEKVMEEFSEAQVSPATYDELVEAANALLKAFEEADLPDKLRAQFTSTINFMVWAILSIRLLGYHNLLKLMQNAHVEIASTDLTSVNEAASGSPKVRDFINAVGTVFRSMDKINSWYATATRFAKNADSVFKALTGSS